MAVPPWFIWRLRDPGRWPNQLADPLGDLVSIFVSASNAVYCGDILFWITFCCRFYLKYLHITCLLQRILEIRICSCVSYDCPRFKKRRIISYLHIYVPSETLKWSLIQKVRVCYKNDVFSCYNFISLDAHSCLRFGNILCGSFPHSSTLQEL